MCHPVLLLLHIQVTRPELRAAVTRVLTFFFFENTTLEKEAQAAAFGLLISTIHMHIICILIQCIGHTAVSKKLMQSEYRAVISRALPHLFPNSKGSSTSFIWTRYKASLNLRLLLQNVLQSQNASGHLPELYLPDSTNFLLGSR